MVDFLLSAERSFGAGHYVEGDPTCGIPGHGHMWTVRVTVQGFINPNTGSAAKLHELDEALGLLVAEVEGRSLNDMIPQSRTNLEGIGMWVLDRLLPVNNKIVEVEIGCPDLRRRCSIKRQPR